MGKPRVKPWCLHVMTFSLTSLDLAAAETFFQEKTALKGLPDFSCCTWNPEQQFFNGFLVKQAFPK